jgi:hypothetical protein
MEETTNELVDVEVVADEEAPPPPPQEETATIKKIFKRIRSITIPP